MREEMHTFKRGKKRERGRKESEKWTQSDKQNRLDKIQLDIIQGLLVKTGGLAEMQSITA